MKRREDRKQDAYRLGGLVFGGAFALLLIIEGLPDRWMSVVIGPIVGSAINARGRVPRFSG